MRGKCFTSLLRTGRSVFFSALLLICIFNGLTNASAEPLRIHAEWTAFSALPGKLLPARARDQESLESLTPDLLNELLWSDGSIGETLTSRESSQLYERFLTIAQQEPNYLGAAAMVVLKLRPAWGGEWIRRSIEMAKDPFAVVNLLRAGSCLCNGFQALERLEAALRPNDD